MTDIIETEGVLESAEEVAKAPEADARTCALVAARAADSKKATDIMVQDVRGLVSVTDYFVIATAANNRQVDAIVEAIEEAERKECHVKPISREGTDNGIWALLDYGNFVVHVFQAEARDYYKLELLWNKAPVVDLAAEAGITDAVYSERISDLLAKLAAGQKVQDI
ncbi:MAG: ribosome silencing factor [Eggerthellaceae bacterium]|nr:ribosome silencing factor [Eggerthellaceae bacterium]